MTLHLYTVTSIVLWRGRYRRVTQLVQAEDRAGAEQRAAATFDPEAEVYAQRARVLTSGVATLTNSRISANHAGRLARQFDAENAEAEAAYREALALMTEDD